jgi:hypothetical protein
MATACCLVVASCGSTDSAGSSATTLRAYLAAVKPVERDLHDTIPLINDVVGTALQRHRTAPRLSVRAGLIGDRLEAEAAGIAAIDAPAHLRTANGRLVAAVHGLGVWMTDIANALEDRPAALHHVIARDPVLLTVPPDILGWKVAVTAAARADHVQLPLWFTRITVGGSSSPSLAQ